MVVRPRNGLVRAERDIRQYLVRVPHLTYSTFSTVHAQSLTQPTALPAVACALWDVPTGIGTGDLYECALSLQIVSETFCLYLEIFYSRHG
jgi:hypothetical protein